jgi:hypothetical protein|tara:strand:+ start:828 stop:1280 length:453 start_codon:yes stop_codon:yes gene_type:complete
MKKKLKDTKLGKFLKEKVPLALDFVGDVLPDQGTLGIVKNIISKDDNLTQEEKTELHNQVVELYKLEVDDRDSARNREIEVSKTKTFDFLFNLTGLVGLGSFAFLVYAIVFLQIPEHNKEIWIHLIGITEGIVLSIVGYYFGSMANKKSN